MNASSLNIHAATTQISREMTLARAAAQGDIVATQSLLKLLVPAIKPVVARLVHMHADRDDALQQVLIAFVRALPSFRGECEPIYFAKRIAVRTALAMARKVRASFQRRDDDFELDKLVSSAESHEDLVRRRRMTLFRDLLAKLSPIQAETLTLRVVLEWTLPEIAAATDAPLNTVRSRLRSSREALHAEIVRRRDLADELGVAGGDQ